MLQVTNVQIVADYILWLRFSDGLEGSVDLYPELEGQVFAPLRNSDLFSKVVIHPELRTIAWPNGADFAPEFLHSLLQSQAIA